jgi:hypothetical protein
MNNRERELQEKIEAGHAPDDESPDTRAYQQVFHALGKQPAYTLPDTFADKVLRKIEQKQERSLRFEYFWLGAGIFLLLAACVTAIVMTGFKFEAGFLRNMAGYKGLVLFGILFILFLHWVDKRFIHHPNASR